MPATVTLLTFTLAEGVGASDREIKLTTTSGLTIPSGTPMPSEKSWLYIDGELMEAVSLGVLSHVEVRRGVGGTAAAPHSSQATIYLGRPDQFFSSDPVGVPPSAVLVSPHINVRTGGVWFAQGNVLPTGQTIRWWQKQETTHGVGPLGIRTTTVDPSTST